VKKMNYLAADLTRCFIESERFLLISFTNFCVIIIIMNVDPTN
jgi:hypothetical protein